MTDLLADRYGRRHRRRPVLVGAVVVLAVAGLAWVGWAFWSTSTPKVTSTLVSTPEIAAHSATFRLKVRLADDDVRATCVVRAYAEDHTPVGELSFTLTDPPGRSFTVIRTMRTERQATAVDSVGCTAPGQNRPR